MTIDPTFEERRAMKALQQEREPLEWERVPVAVEMPIQTLDLTQLSEVRATHKAFAIEQIAPLAEVTLFTGPGSSGKSLLAQQFATAAASGQQCLGLSIMPGPAIYITCEDDTEQLHWRQQHICDAANVTMKSLAGKLHLASLRGHLDNHLCTFTHDGTLKPEPAYGRLVAMINATGAKLVFLDNVAHLFTGNENDRGQVTRFVNLLNGLAGDAGAAIILIAHPNKSGDSYSGSTAWLNAVRSQATLDIQGEGDAAVVDPDARVLTTGKANYSRLGEAVKFRWHKWAFVRDEDLPADTRAELNNVIKGNAENAAFMRCLEAATANKRAVSHNASPSFYANIFPAMREGKRFKKDAYQRAFERLLATGEIELDVRLWQRENRTWQCGIKAVDKCTQHPAQHTAHNHPQVIDNACTEPHSTHTLLSKDNIGQADGPPAHDLQNEEWSKA